MIEVDLRILNDQRERLAIGSPVVERHLTPLKAKLALEGGTGLLSHESVQRGMVQANEVVLRDDNRRVVLQAATARADVAEVRQPDRQPLTLRTDKARSPPAATEPLLLQPNKK